MAHVSSNFGKVGYPVNHVRTLDYLFLALMAYTMESEFHGTAIFVVERNSQEGPGGEPCTASESSKHGPGGKKMTFKQSNPEFNSGWQ